MISKKKSNKWSNNILKKQINDKKNKKGSFFKNRYF
jgi:hypothetical protein